MANNLFFDENLGFIKVMCVLEFWVLGILFMQKGDAKRLSHKDIMFFLIATLIIASFSVSDHVAIPRIGWYAHLLVSVVAVFLRLSVPFVMIISAIKYKEQNIKNQLGFGIVAILLTLPIILIK